MNIIAVLLSIMTALGVLVLNFLVPFGTHYKLFGAIIFIFITLVVLIYLTGSQKKSLYIVGTFLLLLGCCLAIFQYKSEKVANYTGEEKWKEERSHQVYRLDDLFNERTIKNLSATEIKALFGRPEKVEREEGEERYMYVYEGTWGWHQWTEQLYIYFDKNEKVIDYRRETADAVEDVNNLKSPQY